jgi:hypothetical protein
MDVTVQHIFSGVAKRTPGRSVPPRAPYFAAPVFALEIRRPERNIFPEGEGDAMEDNARSARGYRARAAQLRAEAETMSNPNTREALLRIASSYEQLAKRVEKSGSPSN